MAGCSSEPLQGSLLAKRRSATLGAKEEGCGLHEEVHVAALKQHGLRASKEGLLGLQLTGVCWKP